MTIQDLYRVAREEWPDIVVDQERFAATIAHHGTAPGAVKAADLYLAIACIDGNPRALETVRAMLASEVRFAATRTTASQAQIADVIASLTHVLFVDEPDRPAALRTYSARGALASYLRVIARRALARMVNLARREVAVDDDILEVLVPQSDPEISILRERYRNDVDVAMRAAVHALGERERALLRYAFIDGLNVDAVGKLYDVHRATAARWIAAAREQLGAKIRDELAARLNVDVDEVDSIIRLVQSRIDVSLDRVLRP